MTHVDVQAAMREHETLAVRVARLRATREQAEQVLRHARGRVDQVDRDLHDTRGRVAAVVERLGSDPLGLLATARRRPPRRGVVRDAVLECLPATAAEIRRRLPEVDAQVIYATISRLARSGRVHRTGVKGGYVYHPATPREAGA